MNTLDICLKSSVLNEWEPSQDGAYEALSVTRVLQIVKICLNQLSLVSLTCKSVANLKKYVHGKW